MLCLINLILPNRERDPDIPTGCSLTYLIEESARRPRTASHTVGHALSAPFAFVLIVRRLANMVLAGFPLHEGPSGLMC